MVTEIKIHRDVAMSMRDGAMLRADVWGLDPQHPRPAVLMRTPYDRAGTNNDFLRPLDCVLGGYACVVQDTRGRGGSDGDWAVFMADREATDSYDSVEWIAAQPWCDGNVLMAGASYLGIVQLLGAAERPPHLRAIAPAMTSSAALDHELGGGVTRINEVVAWLAYMAMDWLARQAAAGHPVDPARTQELWELAVDPAPALRQRPRAGLPQFDLPGFPVDIDKVLTGGAPGIAEAFRYADIAVPTLSTTGWFDNFCAATIESFLRLCETGEGDPENRPAHRLVVGPWAHDGRLAHCQGELSFSARADPSVVGLARQHLAFFDESITGVRSEAATVRYFLMRADEWRTADRWPPTQAAPVAWYLDSDGAANTANGDGTLRTAAPATADRPADRYVHDPADPVPTRGGRVVNLGRLVPGPLDRSWLESRADVLCYTSPPLTDALDVVGPVVARLFVESSAPSSDFAVKLVDVFPDGRALAVADGIQRVRPAPGAVAAVTVLLGHTAWRFLSGHCLRVEISGSDFPAYDSNPDAADQTVHHCAGRPSRIELSVLGGDAAQHA